MTPGALAARLRALPGRRVVAAVVGPPASGKSTLAEAAVALLGNEGALVAQDGFHLDDAVLGPRGLLPRKGAPETFDVGGLRRVLAAVRAGEEVFVPVFDRAREASDAAARVVPAEARIVVVEGNWLLLDAPGWRDLGPWDLAVMLRVPEAELRRRLERRWAALPPEARAAKIDGNDLPNARLVREGSRAADVVVGG
ncbi:AAA family ATPase [Jannaschia sp. W003]|nr:AAA family ATPase [Jannaschia sp. W003]